jgi:Lhr-like helicase
MTTILVPISPGELIDKITILRIKAQRMRDPAKVANVRHELQLLEATWRESASGAVDISAEERALEAVNGRLWEIEDDIRDHESRHAFDQGFIELARAVYVNNDERAAIKKCINLKLGSKIVEEKSYKDYRKGG